MDPRKVAGCLLGLAIGDALGAPLEGGPPRPVPVRHYLGGGRFDLLPGRYTDDTLQAMAIARSLVVSRGFSPEDAMRRLLEGFLLYPFFFGPTSSTVFRLVLEGMPLGVAAREAHIRNGGSRTNGSVMRGIPIGIFYSNPVDVYRMSLACSSLTHLDPVAGESSAFANLMISRLCRGATRVAAYRSALACCRSEEVIGVLGRFREFEASPSLDALGALHCALSHLMDASSFEDALSRAVSLGGDADTVGSICGAMAGACWGMEEIPPHLAKGLYRGGEILSLAHELWSVSAP